MEEWQQENWGGGWRGIGLGSTHSCSGLWLNPHFSFRFSLPPSVDKQYFCGASSSPGGILVLFSWDHSLLSPGWWGLLGISGTPLDEAIALLSPFLQPDMILISSWLWKFTNNCSELCGILKLADEMEICRWNHKYLCNPGESAFESDNTGFS